MGRGRGGVNGRGGGLISEPLLSQAERGSPAQAAREQRQRNSARPGERTAIASGGSDGGGVVSAAQ